MKPILTKSIALTLVPSLLLLGLLTLVATASATIILFAPVILPVKCAVFLLIIATSVYFILRDALLVLPWSWQTVEVDVKGVLKLTNKNQQIFKPHLAITSFTHEHLTILNFKRDGLKPALPPVLLLPSFVLKEADSFKNHEEIRRLRVWMRAFKHDKLAS